MLIGAFNNGWWEEASKTIGCDILTLPVPPHVGGNAYTADLAARIASGRATAEALAHRNVDLLVDNGGAGLGFVSDSQRTSDLRLAHEVAGVTLFSHFIDPLVTVFQGLDWATVWQSLLSRSWVKAVWDRAQVTELQRFGVPNVTHLPMAAPDREYDTRPLDHSETQPIVSFVGGQNTNYFAPNVNVATRNLLAGTLAHCLRGDLPGMTFYEIYHDIYGLGEPPREADDLQTRIDKTVAYFNAKLFYNAVMCIRNRDRFVIFLKRKLGDSFRIIGRGWDKAYGLSTAPRLATSAEYFNHFREAAINLNLVNGNAESGLNMRHFEITAAGGFMMCYQQPELAGHFEVGKECVVFRDEVDLLEKIEYYLNHPAERSTIALAGQRRTLSEHLYSHRLRRVLELTQDITATAKPERGPGDSDEPASHSHSDHRAASTISS